MRFTMPCKAGQLPIEEKCSAGGMVNAAGSEVGLLMPGLSNRSRLRQMVSAGAHKRAWQAIAELNSFQFNDESYVLFSGRDKFLLSGKGKIVTIRNGNFL